MSEVTSGKFRKKPVVIDACQFTGDFDALNLWLIELGCGDGEDPDTDECPSWLNEDGSLTVATLEGDMRAEIGDWIIRGVKGEFYPCKDQIFRLTYEAVAS